jgi:hypothetical protein
MRQKRHFDAPAGSDAIASRAGHCAAFQSAGRVRRDAVTK